MSCRSTPGNSAVTSYARAASGLSDVQTLHLFHRLVREGGQVSAPTPTPQELADWRNQLVAELQTGLATGAEGAARRSGVGGGSNNVSLAQRQRILNRLIAPNIQARDPDGPTFYAWQRLQVAAISAHQALEQTYWLLASVGDESSGNVRGEGESTFLSTQTETESNWDEHTPLRSRILARATELERQFESNPALSRPGGWRPHPDFLTRLGDWQAERCQTQGGLVQHWANVTQLPHDRRTLYVLSELAKEAGLDLPQPNNGGEVTLTAAAAVTDVPPSATSPTQSPPDAMFGVAPSYSSLPYLVQGAQALTGTSDASAADSILIEWMLDADAAAGATRGAVEPEPGPGPSAEAEEEEVHISQEYADCSPTVRRMLEAVAATDVEREHREWQARRAARLQAEEQLAQRRLEREQRRLAQQARSEGTNNNTSSSNVGGQQHCPDCGQFLSVVATHQCAAHSQPTTITTSEAALLASSSEEGVDSTGGLASQVETRVATNIPTSTGTLSLELPSLPPGRIFSELYRPMPVLDPQELHAPSSTYRFENITVPLRSVRGEVNAFGVLRRRYQVEAAGSLAALSPQEADQLYDFMRRRLGTQTRRLQQTVGEALTIAFHEIAEFETDDWLEVEQEAISEDAAAEMATLKTALEEYQARRAELVAMNQARLGLGYPIGGDPDEIRLGYKVDRLLANWLEAKRQSDWLANGTGLRWPSPAEAGIEEAGPEPFYQLPDYSNASGAGSSFFSRGSSSVDSAVGGGETGDDIQLQPRPDQNVITDEAREPLYIQVKRGQGQQLRQNITQSGLPIIVVETTGSDATTAGSGGSNRAEGGVGAALELPTGAIVLNWGTEQVVEEGGGLSPTEGTPAAAPRYAILNQPGAVALARDKVASLAQLAELAPASTASPSLAVARFGPAFVAKSRFGQAGSGKALIQNPPVVVPGTVSTSSELTLPASNVDEAGAITTTGFGANRAATGEEQVQQRGLGNVLATEVLPYDVYQEYIPPECRKEYRALVLGDEVIALYQRQPSVPLAPGQLCPDSFDYVPQTTISHRQLTASLTAMERVGLDFGGVDLLYDTDNDRWLVLEVNSAPGLGQESLSRLYHAVQAQLQRQ